jgi:hypothetical protein
MKWTKTTRASGLVEWVCEHGVGHPDRRSAQELADKYKHDVDTWLTHSCDGCCTRKDFPGNEDSCCSSHTRS